MIKIKFLVLVCLAIFSCSLQITAQTLKKIKTIIVDAGHGGKDFGAHGGYEGGLNSYEKNVTLAISMKLVEELQKQIPDVKVIPTRTTDIYQDPREKAIIANENKGDLFICIHADAVALQTGRRQTGTRIEIRHTVYYIGKGRKKKKMIKSFNVVVPVYQYYKIGSQRSGTSIWLFAAHKTSDKLKAIMNNEDIQIESDIDSTYNSIDFSTPENRTLAQIYAKRYQEKSIRLASFVDDEISTTSRNALGINQRQKGIWVLQATNMPAILVETGFITNHDDERYLNSEKGQQELAECITRAVKRYKDQLENNKTPAINSPEARQPQKVVEKETEKEKYAERSKNILKKIDLNQANFKVDLYSDGETNGDIVSVYYNGKSLLSNIKLTDKPLTLSLIADKDKAENELLVYAENAGSPPPNKALMIVTDGAIKTEIKITSDSKKNGVVTFSKK